MTKYRKLPVDSIQVAVAYQRHVRKSDISKINANYSEDAEGTILVGNRADKTLWCVDGQTRLEAAKRRGDKVIGCMVFESEGKEHEARAFRLINTQRNVSKLDRLHATLCEGDPNSVEMVAIVERSGFKIGFGGRKAWPHIQSIVPLERAYTAGVLSDVLVVVEKCWGSIQDIQSLQMPVLGGLVRIFARHSEILDVDRLEKKLKGVACATLVGQCNARKMQGGARDAAMESVIIDIYNRGMRKNKLPTLEEVDS